MTKRPDFIYHTRISATIAVPMLSLTERGTLRLAVGEFRRQPSAAKFATWWRSLLNGANLPPDSPVRPICEDMEARLKMVEAGGLPVANLGELDRLLGNKAYSLGCPILKAP